MNWLSIMKSKVLKFPHFKGRQSILAARRGLKMARSAPRLHAWQYAEVLRTLATALKMIAQGGMCVLLGVSSSASEATFDAATFMRTGGASLYGFILFHELPHLVRPQRDWRGSLRWSPRGGIIHTSSWRRPTSRSRRGKQTLQPRHRG
jgi:hypothetical protein